jgi:hypothetical protein
MINVRTPTNPFEVVYNGEVHVPKDIIDRRIQGMMSDFF